MGASEKNLHDSLRVARSVSSCVLWIDEIEKGFSPTDSQTDGGVSRRVLGAFLHFLQTEILDLDILKRTISDLGFSMKENDWHIGHDGQMEHIDLSVRIAPQSDLLFKKGVPGKGYLIITAVGETPGREKIRRIIQMIQQEYAYRKVLHETRKRGFSLVQEERVKAGVIKLILKKVA